MVWKYAGLQDDHARRPGLQLELVWDQSQPSIQRMNYIHRGIINGYEPVYSPNIVSEPRLMS